jgi:hypothetical protein
MSDAGHAAAPARPATVGHGRMDDAAKLGAGPALPQKLDDAVGSGHYPDRVAGNNKQLKRRNHTVNKSYLRRFADNNGRLMRVELPGDERKLMSIGDATVIKNFYVLTLPDRTETDMAEDAFSVVETAATEAIRALVDHQVWPIPPRVREDIAGWMALQYLRGPWVRQLSQEIADAFTGIGVSVRAANGEQFTLKMSDEGMDRIAGAELQLRMIQRHLPEVSAMLCDHDWILTFYQRKRLATSDTPITLTLAEGHPDFMGVGIANAGEIHVPLDRRVGLSLGKNATGDARLNGSVKTALYLNDAMAKNARRYIFHHPEDDPLRGLQLPPPRARELASPAAAVPLVEPLFE